MTTEYEHLVTDIRYPALRVIAQAVRAVIGGTLDLSVQAELENFANECDNRVQHHDADVRREQIDAVRAARAAKPIIHTEIKVEEDLEDLI